MGPRFESGRRLRSICRVFYYAGNGCELPEGTQGYIPGRVHVRERVGDSRAFRALEKPVQIGAFPLEVTSTVPRVQRAEPFIELQGFLSASSATLFRGDLSGGDDAVEHCPSDWHSAGRPRRSLEVESIDADGCGCRIAFSVEGEAAEQAAGDACVEQPPRGRR